jgi:hypothetical protein
LGLFIWHLLLVLSDNSAAKKAYFRNGKKFNVLSVRNQCFAEVSNKQQAVERRDDFF